MRECERCGERYTTSRKKHDAVCTRPMADLASISAAIQKLSDERAMIAAKRHGLVVDPRIDAADLD